MPPALRVLPRVPPLSACARAHRYELAFEVDGKAAHSPLLPCRELPPHHAAPCPIVNVIEVEDEASYFGLRPPLRGLPAGRAEGVAHGGQPPAGGAARGRARGLGAEGGRAEGGRAECGSRSASAGLGRVDVSGGERWRAEARARGGCAAAEAGAPTSGWSSLARPADICQVAAGNPPLLPPHLAHLRSAGALPVHAARLGAPPARNGGGCHADIGHCVFATAPPAHDGQAAPAAAPTAAPPARAAQPAARLPLQWTARPEQQPARADCGSEAGALAGAARAPPAGGRACAAAEVRAAATGASQPAAVAAGAAAAAPGGRAGALPPPPRLPVSASAPAAMLKPRLAERGPSVLAVSCRYACADTPAGGKRVLCLLYKPSAAFLRARQLARAQEERLRQRQQARDVRAAAGGAAGAVAAAAAPALREGEGEEAEADGGMAEASAAAQPSPGAEAPFAMPPRVAVWGWGAGSGTPPPHGCVSTAGALAAAAEAGAAHATALGGGGAEPSAAAQSTGGALGALARAIPALGTSVSSAPTPVPIASAWSGVSCHGPTAAAPPESLPSPARARASSIESDREPGLALWWHMD